MRLRIPSLSCNNRHRVVIYSDDSIHTTNQYTINHDTNILLLSQLFKTHGIGYIHLLLVQNKPPFIQATVSFNSNIVVRDLKKSGLFFKSPVLIPSTNVYIQIL